MASTNEWLNCKSNKLKTLAKSDIEDTLSFFTLINQSSVTINLQDCLLKILLPRERV